MNESTRLLTAFTTPTATLQAAEVIAAARTGSDAALVAAIKRCDAPEGVAPLFHAIGIIAVIATVAAGAVERLAEAGYNIDEMLTITLMNIDASTPGDDE